MIRNTIAAGVFRNIEELLAFAPRKTVIGIDIPIGLTEAGPRVCDQLARRLLGRPRSSSIFPSPIRGILPAVTYRQACSMAAHAGGGGVSCQTWNIVPKIREVDDFLEVHSAYKRSLHEVHPEVSFLQWNGGKAMEHGKKTARGRQDRQRLVEAFFGHEYDEARSGLPPFGWAHDDLLDAFAVLWTVHRLVCGVAAAIPETPVLDAHGLRMQIVS